jgi:hypothetical protein
VDDARIDVGRIDTLRRRLRAELLGSDATGGDVS